MKHVSRRRGMAVGPPAWMAGVAWAVFAGVAVFAGIAVFAGAAAAQEPTDPFPHLEHEGLFPLCAGCHAGAEPQARNATLYPEPSLCVGCHDGVDEERVEWDGPTEAPTNVRYAHDTHDASVLQSGDDRLDCAACHATDPSEPWSVVGVQTESCWSCHATASRDHYGNAECATCHAPLAESGFTLAQVEALPRPEAHEGDAFLLDVHGEGATGDGLAGCVTCHTQDRCLSCHVVRTDVIAAVPAAPARMALPASMAHYPVPSSHEVRGFDRFHVPEDGAETSCGTCHTQDDCAACHVAPAPGDVRALPVRTAAVAPGVQLTRTLPISHEQPFFDTGHGLLALDDLASCGSCHQEETCTACHDTNLPAMAGDLGGGGFHPAAFVARHAAEAFGATMECSSCHSTEVFCRECHASAGFGSTGRLGGGYHTAEPLWLLRHGQAARQTLETCASCHQQNECLQCHSTTGAFSVSPHARGFDANRAWERSAVTCGACHIGDPRGGGR